MIKAYITIIAAILVSPATASAFHSICVRHDPNKEPRYPQTAEGMVRRTCDEDNAAGSECSNSYENARGAMISEHAWLAHEAMRWSGLWAFYDRPEDAPLQYYVDEVNGSTLPRDGVVSVEPASPGRMTGVVHGKRTLNTIPEFAEVPDMSYSLADYILGNEHCFAEHVYDSEGEANRPLWRDRPTEIEGCHHFEMRRASVNSTHFSPQNRSVYSRYHGIALAIAAQCKRVADVLGRDSKHVTSCEREALTFEALASHFLADAWSTGHMWERWGSPLFGKTPIDRLRAQMTAIISGIIHGWKEAIRKYPLASFLQEDQLCMSGFFLNVLSPEEHLEFTTYGSNPALERRHAQAMVRWTYPSFSSVNDEPFFGGGDNYLFACSQQSQNRGLFTSSSIYLRQPRWAVSASFDPKSAEAWPMATQYQRLLTCMAKGFGEVYGSGPKTKGEVLQSHSFDPLITKPVEAEDLCWNMRVTNQSIKLATRISDGRYGTVDFTNPSTMTRLVWQFLPFLGHVTSNSSVDAISTFHEGSKFRIAMVHLGLALRRLAMKDPDGTVAAQLDDKYLRSFYGFDKNSSYLPLLATDQVSYLERWEKKRWGTGLESGTLCAADSDCEASEYCTSKAVSVDLSATGFSKQCVRQETAVLRAFREGEIVHFCSADTTEDISASKRACLQSSGGASVACKACAQVLAPHLRHSGGRSLCERLRDAGLLEASIPLNSITARMHAINLESAALIECQAD